MPTNLKQYFPKIYDNVLEINQLVYTENELFDELGEVYTKALYNQFPTTSDLNGIKAYEQLLNIIAKPTEENLQFRRDRIINRLNMLQPFTLRFLKSKLDEIIGADHYELKMYDGINEIPKYTIVLESTVVDQHWFDELNYLLNQSKPANIEFINTPLIINNLKITEQVELFKTEFNYRLGTTWVLGKNTFTSLNYKGVIKMPDITSITKKYLESIINEAAALIFKIRLNSDIIVEMPPTINVYTEGSNLGGKCFAEFSYEIENDVEITKVELLNSSNDVLTTSDVYIPSNERVILKHKLELKEVI